VLGLKIGVRLEALRLPFRSALETAARLGADGIQFDAVGELAPEQLSQTACRQIRHLIDNHRLTLIALGFPTRNGYDTLDRLEGRVAKTMQVLALAPQLGARMVINHIGRIPEDRNDPKSSHFFDALDRIGNEGDRVGARFAIETGGDSPEKLSEFLAQTKSYAFGVNYNPGNMLVRGYDVYGGVTQLADRILGTRIKDVLRSSVSVSGFREAPMGEGEVDWERFLGAMAEIEYQGFYTIDRETSADPVADVSQAIEFFHRY
jgi:sugar phosphate isomerase/epimerase